METDELSFSIGPFTPETLPMARLAQYLSELATLLGEKEAVHFNRLVDGSAKAIVRVERAAVPAIRNRVAEVRRGGGPVAARRAYHRANSMLVHDRGSAALKDVTGAVILEFPGGSETEQGFSGIIERGSIDGKVIRVGGKDEAWVPVLLQRGPIDYSGITARIEQARELGSKLQRPVRLFGTGKWTRTVGGEWLLNSFKVDDFIALKSDSFSSAMLGLRAVAGSAWGKNAVAELQALRHGETAE